MPASLPSGTVTFLFSDIEGSTPLWEREPQSMGPALARHDAILHAACMGRVYKTVGDAFHAAFEDAGQAVRAALAGTPMTPHEAIDYRMQAAAVREQMGDDLFRQAWAAGRALTMEQAVEYALTDHWAETHRTAST